MAERSKHIDQWKHNRRFLQSVPNDFPDWAITAGFYVAVHAIETVFAQDKVIVQSHDDRNRVLRNTNRYQALYLHYYPLYMMARTIRYFADPTTWIPADQVHKQVISRYLYPIEKSAHENFVGEHFATREDCTVAGAESGCYGTRSIATSDSSSNYRIRKTPASTATNPTSITQQPIARPTAQLPARSCEWDADLEGELTLARRITELARRAEKLNPKSCGP